MLEQPGVHNAIPGAKTAAQIKTNVRAAETVLSDDDLRLIDDVAAAGAALV